MTRAVVADTGPLYAALDPDDQFHARSQSDTFDLEKRGLNLYVASTTVFECYTLVIRRLGIRIAHQWLDEIHAGATLVLPTFEDHEEAVKTVRRFNDQPITLFDALVAVIARRLDATVWSFDHHFDVMGLSPWRQ